MPTHTPYDCDPFHPGERAIHERLGIRERLADIGRRVIRDAMPEQHQRFFGQLPFVLVGSVDLESRPWASVLVGNPGFMRAVDANVLEVTASPIEGDPLREALAPGAALGFLGIELHTRRRNRANGRVSHVDASGFRVRVNQSVGNCPKYIRPRDYAWARESTDLRPRRSIAMRTLDDVALGLVARADTLFVATGLQRAATNAAEASSAHGTDVSHRGGPPGFVQIVDERTLLIPDYAGNQFFMTLGNLQLNPRAGVLFIDFATGDLLTLSGRAEVVWAGRDVTAIDGAERAWRFTIESGIRLDAALPLRSAAS